MPDEVHQVGGVLAVVDREGGVESDLVGIFPQQACADRVERAGPGERVGHDPGVGSERPGAQMRSTRRVISAAARREKVISRMRRGSAPLTIRCATRCARVLVLPDPAPAMTSSAAGCGARIGGQAVFHGQPLLRVQLLEVGQGHQGSGARVEEPTTYPYSCFVRNEVMGSTKASGMHWRTCRYPI